MAEGKGFEPPKGISSFNDLANRRLQPLGHPSAGDAHSKEQAPIIYTAYAGLSLAMKANSVKPKWAYKALKSTLNDNSWNDKDFHFFFELFYKQHHQ